MKLAKIVGGVATLVAIALGSAAATAQEADYPTKSVRVIVPFAAGGTADLVARVVADKLAERLGQTFIIENKPGAGGVIGSGMLADQPADGYTLGLGSVSSHATSVSLRPNLDYDPRTDFTPIALLSGVPNTMVVSATLPVHSVQEFIEYAKKRPNELNFGSVGNGTSQHLGGELFKMRTGVEMVHVPYSDNGLLISDLVNGKIHVIFDNLPNVLGQVQAGNFRALGVTTDTRWPELPDLPTVLEQGVEGFDISSWLGLFGPAGVPEPIVEKLNEEINDILTTPEVEERLIKAGTQPMTGTPEDLAAHVDAEIKRWKAVVEASGAANQ